jgi:hypothetical protein
MHAPLHPLPCYIPISFVLLLSSRKYSFSNTNHEGHLHAIPSTPLYPVPLRLQHLPQRPILKHPQLTYFPRCERTRLTPIQNNWRNYIPVHYNLYIYGKQMDEQKILYKTAADIPRVQSALHFINVHSLLRLYPNI